MTRDHQQIRSFPRNSWVFNITYEMVTGKKKGKKKEKKRKKKEEKEEKKTESMTTT